MSSALLQLLTALIGVGGTLAAAIITQFLATKAERQRAHQQDRRQEEAECFRIHRDIVKVLMLVQDAYRPLPYQIVLALLEDGRTRLAAIPEEGIDGILTARRRERWVESLKAMREHDARLLELVAELALVEKETVHKAARDARYAVRELISGSAEAQFYKIHPMEELVAARDRFKDAVLEQRSEGAVSKRTQARIRYGTDDLIDLGSALLPRTR